MRKTALLFFVLPILLLLGNRLSAQQLAGAYTINSAQPTAGKNFQTFSEAVNALYQGISSAVTFNVAAGSGPYLEQVIISPIPGTSSANTVTFNCNGVTLQFSSSNSLSRAGVKLDGAHHIIFDSLQVVAVVTQDPSSYGDGFCLLRDADSNIIRKCTVSVGENYQNNQNSYGIIIGSTDDYPASNGLSYCDANQITQNTVNGGSVGILIDNYAGNFGYSFTPVNDNQITDNKVLGALTSGIEVQWGNNTLIQGNDISGHPVVNGIHLGEINTKTSVLNNRIHDFTLDANTSSTRSAIYLADCYSSAGNENIIANNLVYNFNTTEECRGIYLTSTCIYNNIYHNTISFDNTAVAGGTISGIYFEGSSIKNINLKNNIITISQGGSGTKRALYIQSAAVADDLGNNDYVVTSSGGTAYLGYYNGHSYSTVTDWQTAIKTDFHSVAISPGYTDLSGGNLKPTEQSLDNRAMYVDVATDIVGVNRSNRGPDMGAYEFLSSPCSTPPISGTTVALPGASVCEGDVIALDLNGNSGGDGMSFQWQTSTSGTGTYTNLGGAQTGPGYNATATATFYYRAALTCAGSTVYSNPIQVIANPALPAGTYTINATQVTGGSNYHSFNDALLAMECGIAGPVVFNVTPGTGPYNEQLLIGAIPGASGVNTITFNGNGETLTYKSTNTSQRATIKLNGAAHFIFDSLHIVAAGASESTDYGIGVHLLLNADSNTIRHCTIDVLKTGTGNRFAGIVINAADNTITGTGTSACDSNSIIGNTINGGYYGIAASTTDVTTLNYHTNISGNVIKDFYQAGVYITGIDSTLISGNDLSRPSRTNAGGLYGIEVTYGNTHFNISGNRIHNLFGGNTALTTTVYGIYVSSSDGNVAGKNTIGNNSIYDIRSAGTQYGLYNSGSDYTLFYHNTVSLDDSTSAVAKASYGFYQTTTATGVEIKNNNFTIRRTSTSTGYALDISSSGTSFTADYNNYLLSTSGHIKAAFAGGTAYTTLSDWQAGANSPDAHSISLDPVYTDPANGNLKPMADVFDNKGTPLGFTKDITGGPRSSTTPDIGAYEFGCPGLPVAVVNPDSVSTCSAVPVSFTISNPGTDTVYNWYDAATAGNQLYTGDSFAINGLSASASYWVEAIAPGGCISNRRTEATVTIVGPLSAAPVVTADSAGVDMIRFGWAAVPDATGYEVSVDGVYFTAIGIATSYVLTGLRPNDTAGIVVKVLGAADCQSIVSARAIGHTTSSTIFIPNLFTPNGDGRNDIFYVYGSDIRELHLEIFNQWGNKVFETSAPQAGWDGSVNGKASPVGVYVYVARITLSDGSGVTRNGMINLLR